MKIAITGGKGGTGKSTIATALAFEMSKKKKVLLVDMDADCPNDHLILGLERKKIDTVYQRIPIFDKIKCTKCGLCGRVCRTNAIVSIEGKEPIFVHQQCNGCGACLIKCPSKAINWGEKEIGWIYQGKKDKLDFLAGELKINEPVSEIIIDELKRIIEKKEGYYDHIILDTAAGTKCDVISALDFADIAYAVTEPTPLGYHDAELIIELLSMLKKSKRIILNREDIGNKNLIKKLARKYNTEIIAKIPYSKKIIDNYSKALPIKNKEIEKIIDKIK